METKYALIWRRDGSEGISWFIRAIKSDGSFYGTIRLLASDDSKRCATNVYGKIPENHWRRCEEVLSVFAAKPARSPGPSFATLARWTDSLGKPSIVLLYQGGDERHSEEARLFLELKTILEEQISPFYPLITERPVPPEASPG